MTPLVAGLAVGCLACIAMTMIRIAILLEQILRRMPR